MSLVDTKPETFDLNQLEKDITESISAKAPDGEDPNAASTTDDAERPDWIEEKFWTGDAEASAKKQHDAYISLQSAHGRMANDLGTQRKLTDRILNLEEKRTNDLEQNTPDPITISGADLLDKPTETLERFLDSRDNTAQDANSVRLDALEAGLAQERFVMRHTDFNEVANSPEFNDWVGKTAYRLNLASAAQQGNWQAATALLDEFKAGRPATTADPIVDDKAADALTEEARAAALESTSSSSDPAKGGKIYSRAALMELRLKKPATYADEAFQAEIMQAYREGRVK